MSSHIVPTGAAAPSDATPMAMRVPSFILGACYECLALDGTFSIFEDLEK